MREERPIIALDFPAFEDVKNFLEHFPRRLKNFFVKIGMEFFLCSWYQKLSTI